MQPHVGGAGGRAPGAISRACSTREHPASHYRAAVLKRGKEVGPGGEGVGRGARAGVLKESVFFTLAVAIAADDGAMASGGPPRV